MRGCKPYSPVIASKGMRLGQDLNSWEYKPLWSVVTCNDDALEKGLSADDEIRYVDISAVTHDQGISRAEVMSIANAPSRAQRRAKSGDVVVSTVRTYLKAIAEVSDNFADCVFSTGFAVLRSRSNVLHSRYLKWLVLNDLLVQAIEAHSTGVSYPAINASELLKLKIPLPPYDQQVKICEMLDHETGRIDALIKKKTSFIELLKEKRQALITQAVTKGLDPNVPMCDSGVEWIGIVPEGWRVGRVRWYSQIQSGIAIGSKPVLSHSIELPYLRVANVQDGHLDLREMKAVSIPRNQVARYSLMEGDVLMNEGGDNDKLGRGAVWRCEFEPCLHQNHVFAVRPTKGLMSEWLALYTQSQPAKAHFRVSAKQSTNLASISSTNIKELILPIPSLDEQVSILEKLGQQSGLLDKLVKRTQDSIELLKERRSALITAAVTGQIDLRGGA